MELLNPITVYPDNNVIYYLCRKEIDITMKGAGYVNTFQNFEALLRGDEIIAKCNDDEVGKPIARLVHISYGYPPNTRSHVIGNAKRLRLEFIPIGDDGTDLEPVHFNCLFRFNGINFNSVTISMFGKEVNRQIDFNFQLQFKLLGKASCRLTGVCGTDHVVTDLHSPIDIIPIVINLCNTGYYYS